MSLINSNLTDVAYSTAQFELASRHNVSQTTDGRIFTTDRGTRYWLAVFQTIPYHIDDSFEILAAVDSLKGNHAEFWDVSNTGLKSKDDFVDNLFKITAISADRTGFAGTGIPNGTRFTAGDYLSITSGSKKSLVRVASTVTKTQATVNIKVVPALRNVIGNNHFISCRNPSAYFQILPGSVTHQVDAYTKHARIGFRLIEFLG